MPTILLVRHGQGSFGGADYDVLAQRGVAQAALLADALQRFDSSVSRVISGSLARQCDTALPTARALGRDVVVDRRWDEYEIEDVLGHHSSTAARPSRPPGSDAPDVSPAEFQDALERALSEWIAAGAESGAHESWPSFNSRVIGALTELAGELGSGEVAIVFTSGGVIAAVCVALLGVPDASLVSFNRVVVNAGVTKQVHGRRGTALVSFNEHGHLERDGSSLVTYR